MEPDGVQCPATPLGASNIVFMGVIVAPHLVQGDAFHAESVRGRGVAVAVRLDEEGSHEERGAHHDRSHRLAAARREQVGDVVLHLGAPGEKEKHWESDNPWMRATDRKVGGVFATSSNQT